MPTSSPSSPPATARHLQPTFFLDADHPAVAAYATSRCDVHAPPHQRAVQLYYAVRDDFRYSPWDVKVDRAHFKASTVLAKGPKVGAHCIDKANVLATSCRAVGVPSRLHFANVRNHIGTEALEQQLGTDLLVFHGYAELWLDGRWVAATPAFNKELCEMLGVAPLEFDGRTDSIFQQYDRAGGQFMEYVHDYGVFDDIPFELMIGEWNKHYAPFRQGGGRWPPRPGGS